MELRGKHVWLIGASTGIGAALVAALATEGAILAISSRSEQQLQELAAKHTRPEAPIAAKPLDVTEAGAIERTEAELRAHWGRIDVLIYNAGTWAPVEVDAWDVAAFERMIAVNYTGMMRAIAAVLPDMLSRRDGEIAGVGSLSAYGAFPRAEAYGSTKAAVNYMLQALRFDVAKRGIGVTTINPGFVKTRLTDANEFPMPFLLKPEQAAAAIVKGLRSGKTEIHFPLRLSLPLKLATSLPRPLYEWLLMRTVKK